MAEVVDKRAITAYLSEVVTAEGMIVKANSFASLRWALCAGAFVALFPACMPDGTSPELPIMQAGSGAASGAAAGSGAAGSAAGSSAAGRGVSSGSAGAMAGRSGGAAGMSTSPASGGSGTGGAGGSMGAAGRMAGAAGAMAGAGGGMGMAGRAAAGAGGSMGGMGGAMAMAGRGGMGGMGGAAAGGMGGMGGGGATTAATFTEVYGLIMAGCSCHVSGSPGNLGMANKMTAYTNLVGANSQACGGQKRVVANDPANSVLFHSIDRSMLGSCNVPAMPAGGMAKWSQANIDKVKAWIMAGAMNN